MSACVFSPCTLTEKDINNEVLWAWSYPAVDGGLRDLLMRKCTLDQDGAGPYTYGHYSQHWYYLRNFQTDNPEQLPKVSESYSSGWPEKKKSMVNTIFSLPHCVCVLVSVFVPQVTSFCIGVLGKVS